MVKKQGGFTLAEMLMVVAILGILALVGPRMIVNLVQFIQLHTAKTEIQRDARAALDIVNRFLRQAKGYTIGIDQITGQPPYSRISFQTFEGRTMMFYQQGTRLYQVDRSTTMVTNNLRYIAFTYPRSDDPTLLSVAITMEKSTYQGGSKALELSIEKVRIMN
jgi:prepilin-type N-terminal cleavage/methylation domain-containing protein